MSNRRKRSAIWFLGAMLLFPGVSSCTRENWSLCPNAVPGIKIVTAAVPGVTIDPADIRSVNLYVFGSDSTFLDLVPARVGEVIYLDYPKAGELHVVALGNTDTGEVEITDYPGGGANHITEGNLLLKQSSGFTRANPAYSCPGDLFYGRVIVENNGREEEQKEIPVQRIVAAINIKAIALREFVGTPSGDFRFVVSTCYNQVSFFGEPSGEEADYFPAIQSVITGNVCEQPTFNMFSSHSGSHVTVRVYHDSQLIDTVTADSDGNPLVAVNGKLLNVHIDYTGRSIDDGNLSVTVSYSGWGNPLEVNKGIN